MILVTVGGVKEYKFERIFSSLDDLIDEGVISPKDIIVQSGFNKLKDKKYESFDFLDNSKFNDLVDKADFIISHAGVGNVISMLKKKKKVIVFPRLHAFNEHIDDHQLDLCDFVEKNNFCVVAKNKDELKEAILNIDKFEPNEYLQVQNNISNLIINFIEKDFKHEG